ncbi:uncharacterized protein G2W53_040505 [Senna tora]|uniref:Uncharacterized protein n=1 Tax=Senna tora TaxID=362788 RepID=A0A834W212_9FABA|nr:uncharacterized protein G2W53_040505 [Senna tora]
MSSGGMSVLRGLDGRRVKTYSFGQV